MPARGGALNTHGLAAKSAVFKALRNAEMSRGGARRRCGDWCEFAALLDQLGSYQAITLYSLRPGLADKVEILTKRKLSGTDQSNLIARLQDYLSYRNGEPALALIDFDQQGMPADVAERLTQHGGLPRSICAVLPEIGNAARVIRRSTSAGLHRADTGEPLPGSGGEHILVPVPDGSDIERFLRTLHDRCFRHGFGWHLAGSAGQLPKRSIVNRVVDSPDWLVFDAPPVLDPRLAHDKPVSLAVAADDDPLEAVVACPPLRILELAIREQQLKLRHQLWAVRDQTRSLFITQQIERLATRTGMALDQARRMVKLQCAGILLLALALPAGDCLLDNRVAVS
jgi:hypothetical protein